MTIVPQPPSVGLRYRTEIDNQYGARVQIWLRNTNAASMGTNGMVFLNGVTFDGQDPQKLLMEGDWAWHDTPGNWTEEETSVPPQGVVMLSFNTRSTVWGLGKKFNLEIVDWQNIAKTVIPIEIQPPKIWLSSVTFLNTLRRVYPEALVFHVANQTDKPQKIAGVRIYLPQKGGQWRLLRARQPFSQVKTFNPDGVIPPGDKGGARVSTESLPLTYAALEVILADPQGNRTSVWGHVRIKRESFDISAGHVDEEINGQRALASEFYLKTLWRMHINTANIVSVPGYTDQLGAGGLYTFYPLKRFGKFEPASTFDKDEMLPIIHGVDCVGEPQYAGNGMPRFPQTVFLALQPYAATRLTTTVTLGDESSWRRYSGLSDYPNFVAFRVAAPAADDWPAYDRWPDGKPIGWGAPLETIGDLARSLRESSRPAPIACWVQGPHAGWTVRDGRKRTAPTADEIRMQAYHALSSRVTSLYWHDLGLKGIVQFRDTIDEITRIGREILMLEPLYLEGDAYKFQRTMRDGSWDWDLASIAAPQGALLFALDLDYEPDRSEKIFEFKRKRDATFLFELPQYLRRPAELYRVDADGIYDVKYFVTEKGVAISDKQHKTAIYVATHDLTLRSRIESKRQDLLTQEQGLNFDPASKGRDFDTLKAILLQK